MMRLSATFQSAATIKQLLIRYYIACIEYDEMAIVAIFMFVLLLLHHLYCSSLVVLCDTFFIYLFIFQDARSDCSDLKLSSSQPARPGLILL